MFDKLCGHYKSQDVNLTEMSKNKLCFRLCLIMFVLGKSYSFNGREGQANVLNQVISNSSITEKNLRFGINRNDSNISSTKTKKTNENDELTGREDQRIYKTKEKTMNPLEIRSKIKNDDKYNIKLNKTENNNSPENRKIEPEERKNTEISDHDLQSKNAVHKYNNLKSRRDSPYGIEEDPTSRNTERTNSFHENTGTEIEYEASGSTDHTAINSTSQESMETTTVKMKKSRSMILQEIQNHTQTVDIKNHPFIVSVQKDMIHSCCGTIVSDFWILTAAHCLTSPGSSIQLIDATRLIVVAGQSQLGLGKMQLRRIRDIYIHRRFQKKLFLNNIGMINLFQPFDLNDYVNVIHLSSSLSKPYKFFGECHVVSWTVYRKDFLSFDKLRAEDKNTRRLFKVPELQKVNLPTITIEECFDRIKIKEFLTQRDHICTEYGTYKNIACVTDAGSPLICGDRQYGIFSWGIGCDEYEYPGVFTNVASFRKWINNIGTDPNEYISRNGEKTWMHIDYSIFILIELHRIILLLME